MYILCHMKGGCLEDSSLPGDCWLPSEEVRLLDRCH